MSSDARLACVCACMCVCVCVCVCVCLYVCVKILPLVPHTYPSNGTGHFKNLNNCLNTNVNLYLETLVGKVLIYS
jgi:hypothetical protein